MLLRLGCLLLIPGVAACGEAEIGGVTDGGENCLPGEPDPLAPLVTADDIPVAHTPGCGWDEFPPPILKTCTEPLVPEAPDLRGLWEAYSGMVGHIERIEQCGNRVVITSGGIIHDMRADGALENGSMMSAAGPANPSRSPPSLLTASYSFARSAGRWSSLASSMETSSSGSSPDQPFASSGSAICLSDDPGRVSLRPELNPVEASMQESPAWKLQILDRSTRAVKLALVDGRVHRGQSPLARSRRLALEPTTGSDHALPQTAQRVIGPDRDEGSTIHNMSSPS